MAVHYVDNKTFLKALIEYRAQVAEAKDKEVEIPRIPEYIGTCLYQIATRLSTKPNFVNYTYRDEMISDGIENCINYLLNFDPEKSSNPFAYFTQIIYYAFLRRIEKEKRQVYIKHKSYEQLVVEGGIYDTMEGDDTVYDMNIDLDKEAKVEFVRNYEEKMAAKKK